MKKRWISLRGREATGGTDTGTVPSRIIVKKVDVVAADGMSVAVQC